MRFILLSLFIFAAGAEPTSFESDYLLLQKKITSLKDKGQAVTEDTRKEIDTLMVQMNHEHAVLKHELEVKNSQLTQKVNEGVKTSQDWSGRAAGAYHELADGMKRAWQKINKASD